MKALVAQLAIFIALSGGTSYAVLRLSAGDRFQNSGTVIRAGRGSHVSVPFAPAPPLYIHTCKGMRR